MFVRNFFTKAVAEDTGCFAFFTGSVLGNEAIFIANFDKTDHFYLKEMKGLWVKPYLRVRIYRLDGNVHMWTGVELYNAETGSYEPAEITKKDKAFLLHVIRTNFAIINKAKDKAKDREDKIVEILTAALKFN